jgi:hypothetical protein
LFKALRASVPFVINILMNTGTITQTLRTITTIHLRDTMTILSHIQNLLEEQKRECTLIPPSSASPQERLLVLMNIHNREDAIEITAHLQQIPDHIAHEIVAEPFYLIQFQSLLTIQVPPTTFSAVSNSLHFFNRLSQCPGFELDELSDQVLYRYVWFVKENGFDSFLLMQILGTIQLYLEMFSPHIQEIAKGAYTLPDVLEQVLQLAKKQLS